jgi:hypothetical protein
VTRQAHFSEDGKHRYWLLRSWDASPRMMLIIGLNPSTADDTEDDPTIRSCIRLATSNGYGGFIMCNLYSFITAYPDVLRANMAEANRQKSNETLVRMIRNTHHTVCAWGSWSFIDARADEVIEMIKANAKNGPFCFGVNNGGSPKHPLYLNSKTKIDLYTCGPKQ